MTDPVTIVRDCGLVRPGDEVLVACSGGADSWTLLLALRELGCAVVACYVDHGTRPGAAADGRWVVDRCADLGVPVQVRTLPGGGTDEASMRRARYAALTEVAREHGLRTVATGHTLDDQAETVVLRLLRGARTRGLAGIPAARDLAPGLRLVRPLLRARRAGLRQWLAAQGQAWREDPTNREPRYLRNRVRLLGLPADAELLAALADICRAVAQETESRARHQVPRGFWPSGHAADGPACVRRRALELWFGGPLEGRHLDALDRLVAGSQGSAEVHLPGGRRAVREYGRTRIEVGPGAAERAGWATQVAGPGVVPLPSGGMVLSLSLVARDEVDVPVAGLEEALFDAAEIGFPITVRSRRPGDRVRPLGGPGSRKLQDVLVDARVPRARRGEVPVVESQGRILWLPGVVRSSAAPVRSSTSRVLRMCRKPL